MAWLLLDGEVLASLDVARTRTERRRGLRGRSVVERPLLLVPCRSVHTFGMRADLDVAFLDAEGHVVSVRRVRRRRVTPPVRGAVMVLEMAAGDAGRWNVDVGTTLSLEGVDVVRTRRGARLG